MTKKIKIGDVLIGGGSPVLIQSMTNVDTADVEGVVKQINQLEDAGCEIIRASVYDENCANALPKIKEKVSIPLVADIHFDYRLAIASIENGADKIRINPGNIGSEDRVKMVVDCAKSHGVPIRVGVNSGSLPKDLLQMHGNSTKAMVMAALRHVEILEKFGFYDIVVSIKSSSVVKTIDSCVEFDKVCDYPQHIGVTEAGSSRQGFINAAIGIGSLLHQGIGDTIRVSLSGDPLQEVYAGWDILNALDLRHRGINVVSCPTCARKGLDVEGLAERIKQKYINEKKYLKIAVMGCVVNGPGEAKDADIGIAGGKDYSVIFSKGDKQLKVDNVNAYEVLCKKIDELLIE